MGGETAFADDEEHFILDVVRQGYATQLQAAHPSGYVRVLHGVEHVAELVFLLGSIGIGSGADVFVQFFVIVIFYLLADGCQQAVTFADSCCPQHSASTSCTSGMASSSPRSIFFCSFRLRIIPAVAATRARTIRLIINIHMGFLFLKTCSINRTDKDTHCFVHDKIMSQIAGRQITSTRRRHYLPGTQYKTTLDAS